jgi:hypothetical protein
MPKKPLKFKELVKKLKRYGIMPLPNRGKGSEIILHKPVEERSTKGPQYPIKNHGDSTEISIPVILEVLRRFNIDADEFWE